MNHAILNLFVFFNNTFFLSFRITKLRNRLHMEREEHAKAIQREVDCRKEL